MPTTRKKVIKTVYKDNESENEGAGDFSDSGSEAEIFEGEDSSSEEEHDVEIDPESSEEEVARAKVVPAKKPRAKNPKKVVRKPNFTSNLVSKIHKQSFGGIEDPGETVPTISVKDLTDADKLLPPILQLSESDSSEDESQSTSTHQTPSTSYNTSQLIEEESEHEQQTEFKDVWSKNIADSEKVAKEAFKVFEEHKNRLEETKASLLSYKATKESQKESDVNDLLALGEEVIPESKPTKKKTKKKFVNDGSDSDGMDDWEEVEEKNDIPQQGLQLVVDFPDAVHKKKKEVDIEMMMKRKMNRVKKEYQVFMHKVHVLCWLGHGNYVSRVLNDQDILAAALSLVPSKDCYPGERVDVKYVEQITNWYKDKVKLKQDKHEDKFRPKAPPLKTQLLSQLKSRVVTSKKYIVFIFVSMLRALGLQCRVMFNFVTLPIKPPVSELCSLSTKPKEKATTAGEKDKANKKKPVTPTNKSKSKKKIAQFDGIYDSDVESNDFDNILQIDGNDDSIGTKSLRSNKTTKTKPIEKNDNDVSPPKRSRKSLSLTKPAEKEISTEVPPKRRRTNRNIEQALTETSINKTDEPVVSVQRRQRAVKNKGIKEVISDIEEVKRSPTPSTRSKKVIKDEKVNENTEISNPSYLKQTASSNKIKDLKKQVTNTLDKSTKKIDVAPKPTSNRRKSNKESNEGIEKVNEHTKETSNSSESKQTAPSNKTKDLKMQVTNTLDKSTKKIDVSPKPTANRRKSNKESNEGTEIKAVSVKNTKDSMQPKGVTNLKTKKVDRPDIIVTEESETSSIFFTDNTKITPKARLSLNRNRSATNLTSITNADVNERPKLKPRTRSAPSKEEKSQYFEDNKAANHSKRGRAIKDKVEEKDQIRVSHRDLKAKGRAKNMDIKVDLINIIKGRVKEAKAENKKKLVKGAQRRSSGEDSDYLPEAEPPRRPSEDDFKPTKVFANPKLRAKIDRRVISTDDEAIVNNKIDVWCEVFVEELEQWIAVDILKGQVHCTTQIYSQASHPVAYIVGWDNNNYLKDLTRRYVPHWNTVTRKHRAEPSWWTTAVKAWLGPRTARDREEDEGLDKMQLEAPLPKSISEYKNHPLYALRRHLLKFEAIYPPDAAVLGYVRNEPVYARECVYVCKSRDIWLKEAKVVKMNEKPYKIVKKRKFDRARNVLETDHPLEIFGPWQTQDYEPPVAENGVVPRNAYGNVELFQPSMLPKGTVHIKLPGLHKVAKKCGIDCAAAITGFDFNGGWSHPVYDGYVVCQEFEEIITEAWLEDQEEQQRREVERLELRVYGNWKKLIKGLLIRERLKQRYGFEEVPTVDDKKKHKGPRLVVKKK